jgi:[ribosomal protein S5]-alanine N-acetyltransferase
MNPPSSILETDRLCLWEFVEEDAQAFFELNSNPDVVRFTGDGPLTSVEEARKGLRERPINDYRTHGFGRWAVVHKQSDKIIGFAGLKYLDDLQEVDLGYRLLPEYWGQGLTTEASIACVQYGLTTLKLPRILGLVDPANVASVRVLEKSGLTFDTMIEYRSQQVAMYSVGRL